MVRKFHAYFRFPDSDRAELEQVAYMTFLELIKKTENAQTLNKTYFKAIISRLYYFYEKQCPVKIRHADFYKTVKELSFTPMDDVADTLESDPENERQTQFLLEDFLTTLTEEQRSIVLLKLKGVSQETIKKTLRLKSVDYIYRQMRKVREKFAEWERL